MRYFPVFHDLDGRTVVIVGGGEEALRKVRLLARTPARLVVVAAGLHPELAANERISWLARAFDASLLDGADLVVAADPALNDAVAAAARVRGLPVNVVDRPDLSSFIVPSIVDRAPLVIAIGSEGVAPVLAQGLRARIDAMLPQGLGSLAAAAGALREPVAARVPPGSRRRSFWQRFFFGDVRDDFLAGDTARFSQGVEALLADESLPAAGRVAFVDTGPGDAELITLKAQRLLQEADVIVHDRSVAAAILELARRDAVRLALGTEDFTAVTDMLVRQASAGHRVVRLRRGAVAVEELAGVAAEGVAVEAVPGVGTPATCQVLSFPVREDARDQHVRAVS